ncbi:hypothetical protein OnM2_019086, partial [Erysiphe neolycopersici]
MELFNALILIILALLLPPLAVLLKDGCGTHLLMNIILTLLGFFPGIVHALYVLCTHDNRSKKKNQAPLQNGPKDNGDHRGHRGGVDGSVIGSSGDGGIWGGIWSGIWGGGNGGGGGGGGGGC